LLILAAIAIYRATAPRRVRERCLFAVSCSEHVRRAAEREGARAAWAAFRERFARCRGGYRFVTADAAGGAIRLVVFADGSCADVATLRPHLRPVAPNRPAGVS
jgi:putative component of membrane protein insertase Oxa1/YidC/SpoIIIJ protein YidD